MDRRLLMSIEVYSHFFKVKKHEVTITNIIESFTRRYVIYKDIGIKKDNDNAKTIPEMTVFAHRTEDGKEYRMHIGQLEAFMKHLEYSILQPHHYEVIHKELYEPTKIKVEFTKDITPRDYQIEVNDFILDKNPELGHSRLVGLPVGTGKTASSLYAISNLKQRCMIVILPTFMEQWAEEVTKKTNTKAKEVMMVQGSSQLDGLVQLAQDGHLTSKFIIVSLSTFRSYIKNFKPTEHNFQLEDICKILGIGAIILDETHMQLHAVYTFLVHTHVPKVIALSATFLSDDPKITEIQHLMFPRELRYDKLKMEQYIKVYSVSYMFKNMTAAKIRTSTYGMSHYSHTEFEKALVNNRLGVLDNYFKMIGDIVQIGYINKYEDKDKMLIFASTIALCTKLVDYLRVRFAGFKIRRFVESDSEDHLVEGDIIVSTIGSAGTGLDIKHLRVSLMTTSISSSNSNIQALGRLRKLPDRDCKFYYIYCEDIKKQVSYHRAKLDLFRDRVASTSDSRYPNAI